MAEPQKSAQLRPYCVFAHGWAYSLDFFTPLLEALRKDHPALMQSLDVQGLDVFGLEQGYFHRPAGVYKWTDSAWTLSALPSQYPACIGIGHSLGLAKLLGSTVQYAQLLSLHGFTRFTALERGQTGTPRRLVERMLSKLEQSPDAVLQDFWTRAEECAPPLHSHFGMGETNLDKLREDLRSMINLDLTKKLAQLSTSQFLAVCSPKDQIVSPELSADTFPPSRLQTVNAPHSGPLVIPKVYTALMALALNNATAPSAN